MTRATGLRRLLSNTIRVRVLAATLLLLAGVLIVFSWIGVQEPNGVVLELPIQVAADAEASGQLLSSHESDTSLAAIGAEASTERMEVPSRSTHVEPDVTRLELTACAPDGRAVESARFEVILADMLRNATPISTQHKIVSSAGAAASMEVAPTVLTATVIASAAGYAPGRTTVKALRHVDGTYRSKGLVQHSISVELKRHEPHRCLEGGLSIDGVPGAPANLDLQLFTPTGERIRDVEYVVDRFAHTYCIGPLPSSPSRLQVLGDGIAPLWLAVPDERPAGALQLDVAMSAGKTAQLAVVDAETGSPLAGLALRVEVSIDAWRRSGARGQAGHIAIVRTDDRGQLVVSGLPEAGRLLVTSNDPPRVLEHGGLVFAPGQEYFQHTLAEEDPAVIRDTIRLASTPPAKCTLWGPHQEVASGQGTLVLASVGAKGARLVRLPLGTTPTWELQVDPAGPAHLWLESEGTRVSAVLPVNTTPFDRVGPIVFSPRSTTPVSLSWSGAKPNDQMTVVLLGGAVDEEIASLRLEADTGQTFLELEGACELGLALQRGDTSLRRSIRWNPSEQDELCVEWPPVESVDVLLHADGVHDFANTSVVLVPLQEPEAPAAIVHLEDGLARQQSLAPGRYFFRLEDAGQNTLVAGIAEYIAGAGELALDWRGCPVTVLPGSIELVSSGGVDLASIPAHLRTIMSTQESGAEVSRPLSLRLPCESEWSQIRQLKNAADASE